ncbi:MAG: glutamyl-tRNA reductase [Chitinispirillaceae bacterium]|nr:glutamyl-tRNA reductase [Chitinispirillaceae bacterium]
MLHIGVVGTDFRKAPLKMRDALYLDKERVLSFINSIPKDAPICEIVVLSTCNRIEIYYVAPDHEKAAEWVCNHLAQFHKVPFERIKIIMNVYKCDEAVKHLFRVASGMESMVFGEYEILGQVKEAYFHCLENSATSSFLNRLFQQAIATGKKVRNTTLISRGAVSIASVAIEKMIEICGRNNLKDKKILLVGAGNMGFRVLKRLKSEKIGTLTLCNRTESRALKLAEKFKINTIKFESFSENLSEYDVVILAAAVQMGEYILKIEDIKKRENCCNKPLLIIDIGAPRNSEEGIENLENVKVVKVDDLKEIAQRRLLERKNDIETINNIIEEQIVEFTRWYRYKINLLCKEKK